MKQSKIRMKDIIVITPASYDIFQNIAVVWELTSTDVVNHIRTKSSYEFVGV